MPRLVVGAWTAAGWAGVGYGVLLTVMAFQVTPGDGLTGLFFGQPVVKAAMALLLLVAAAAHPIVRERRWLMPALAFSAAGDIFLAIPWWGPAFTAGLASFLLAHICYLGALVPLATRSRARLLLVAVTVVACGAMLVWFWPHLGADTIAVTAYIGVLCAMVCAALLARLPTPWTALGAVCFAVSDGMIGTGRFVLESEVLAVPIWWAYAAAQILITAGFFFGRHVTGADDEAVATARESGGESE